MFTMALNCVLVFTNAVSSITPPFVSFSNSTSVPKFFCNLQMFTMAINCFFGIDQCCCKHFPNFRELFQLHTFHPVSPQSSNGGDGTQVLFGIDQCCCMHFQNLRYLLPFQLSPHFSGNLQMFATTLNCFSILANAVCKHFPNLLELFQLHFCPPVLQQSSNVYDGT